jgi:hypothetical protein
MPDPRIPVAQVLDAITAGRFPWWYPDGARGLAVDAFVNAVDFTPLVAGGTQTQTINIPNDSAFVILSAELVATDTANTVFLAQAPVLSDLSDAGSGRHFSNTPVHVSNWFGTAQLPNYWQVPKIIAPNSAFNVTLQNLDLVNNRNIRVAFTGFKIFGFRP